MKRKIILIITITAVILISLFYYPLRSYTVMRIYSAVENRNSVMANNDYKIKMKSDKMWYPFVITFNTTGFGRASGTGADMSIMYNFAKFDNRKSSLIYDTNSPYYSAFYGAYALTDDEIYGFNDGVVDVNSLIIAFKYDYRTLVLKSVGCKYPVFTAKDYSITENVNYIGIDGWTLIEAEIITNGMAHNYTSKERAYIQYGLPTDTCNEDFAQVNMMGRLYARYFEEYSSTIVIYVMAQDINVIDSCDDNILSKTQIINIS